MSPKVRKVLSVILVTAFVIYAIATTEDNFSRIIFVLLAIVGLVGGRCANYIAPDLCKWFLPTIHTANLVFFIGLVEIFCGTIIFLDFAFIQKNNSAMVYSILPIALLLGFTCLGISKLLLKNGKIKTVGDFRKIHSRWQKMVERGIQIPPTINKLMLTAEKEVTKNGSPETLADDVLLSETARDALERFLEDLEEETSSD